MGQVKKLTVTDCISNNGWFNLTTEQEGKVSVMESKCPIISAKLKDFLPGLPTEIEVDFSEKDGKKYGWDVKEKKAFGGGFKSNPRKDALTLAVQLACHGKIDVKELSKYSDNLLKYLNNESI